MSVPIASKASLKVLLAVGVVGLGGNLQPPAPPDTSVMRQAVTDSTKRGQYAVAALQAESMVRLRPREPEAYAAWILSLAMANRITDARAALEKGKRALPHMAEQYGPVVSDIIDKIEGAHEARAEAARAGASGLPVRAAHKLGEAYEVMSEDRGLGLQAAQMWAWVKEPIKAALIYRKLAETDDPDLVEAAEAFFAEKSDELVPEAVKSLNQGWTLLDEGGDTAKAVESFKRTIALVPKHGLLVRVGVDGMRSPYVGLATAAAVLERDWEIDGAFTAGGLNGMPEPKGPLQGRAGTKLGLAMCDEARSETLYGAFGPGARGWGKWVCSQAETDRDWREAVDRFDAANLAGTDPAQALDGFQATEQLFARAWDGPRITAAADYASRSKCNVAFLKAWIRSGDPSHDTATLESHYASAVACPTSDFSMRKLAERMTGIRAGVAKKNMFPVKLCNRTTEEKISVAAMREKPEASAGLTLTGWWVVARGQCVQVSASYGTAAEASVYLTADSKSFTWWPREKADATTCVPAVAVERPGTLSELSCPAGETLRGFVRLTARKGSKGGITYNFKTPAPVSAP